MDLALALLFAALGSAGAVLGAAGVLFIQARLRFLLALLVSYATGTLLASAFLGLLPEALERRPGTDVPAVILAGIFGFFVLEKLVLWRHSHDMEAGVDVASGELILIGDFFHNLVDGVIIGGAFATDASLGLATALAVIAHEVPQEVGDFAILLDSGFKRGRALAYNVISASPTVPATAVAYLALGEIESGIPFILAIAAASFIYIALADLVPRLHERRSVREIPGQLLPILGGSCTIILVKTLT